jgi:hypothetical protein
MRNQLTVNAAKGAGFKVIGWESAGTANQELLLVEDANGARRYFNPLQVTSDAFEVLLKMNFNIKFTPEEDKVVVSTNDLSRTGYYVSVDNDPSLTAWRKANVVRELITFLAADYA